jgi:mRNA interferase RelE/StbE
MLRRIENPERTRLILASQALSHNPFPAELRRVVGPDNIFRVRVGDYRILYTVEHQKMIVLVLTIGHRRDIYRQLAT